MCSVLAHQLKPEVVNRHNVQPRNGDVYIGRPGPFGNKYVMKVSTLKEREWVIAQFRDDLIQDPRPLIKLKKLNPKRLVCFCKPLACHGDVYLELWDVDFTELED